MKLLPWKSLKNALNRLCRLRLHIGRPRAAAPVGGAALVEASEATDPDDDDKPRACGWFDSSHDLQHGLRVQEHLQADALARELPLAAWLELQLGGWPGSQPALRNAG